MFDYYCQAVAGVFSSGAIDEVAVQSAHTGLSNIGGLAIYLSIFSLIPILLGLSPFHWFLI